MSGVGSGAPPPPPTPVGTDAEETGQGPPGQPGFRLEPLQPPGKVLGENEFHRPVNPPLAAQELLPGTQGVHHIGEKRVQAAGHPTGQLHEFRQKQISGQTAPPQAIQPIVLHPRDAASSPQVSPDSSRKLSRRSGSPRAGPLRCSPVSSPCYQSLPVLLVSLIRRPEIGKPPLDPTRPVRRREVFGQNR